MPQGSVVGPLLFICYTAPVEDIILAHGFSTMMYADDTQLYVTIKPTEKNQMVSNGTKWYLNSNTTEVLVHAFVTSQLDSCNCLLLGAPEKEISKLQRIQNSAARLVSRAKKSDHITQASTLVANTVSHPL